MTFSSCDLCLNLVLALFEMLFDCTLKWPCLVTSRLDSRFLPEQLVLSLKISKLLLVKLDAACVVFNLEA